MVASLVALGSCTIAPRDPASTLPRPGRLQFDVRPYGLGALAAFCDTDSCILGPDGEPLRGLGVNLTNRDQIEADAQPDATYVNPLRVAPDNSLYVDLPTQYQKTCDTVAVGGFFIDGTQNLGAAASACVSNPSTTTAGIVERWVQVENASIENPPGTAGGTIAIEASGNVPDAGGNVTLTGTLDCDDVNGCLTSADALLRITSETGATYDIVRAQTGQASVFTGRFDLPDVSIAAGADYTSTAQMSLQMITAASDRFPINGGTLTLCARLVLPPPNDGFTTTPTCA